MPQNPTGPAAAKPDRG